MKRGLAMIVFFFLISVLAYGQSAVDNSAPASREQILKMMDAMQSRKTVQVMMNSMQQQIGSMMKEQMEKSTPEASPEMRAEMTAAMQDMFKDMEPIMSDVVEETIPVYQKHLSQQEAEAITAFYLSPEGKSFLNILPVIMNDSMSIAMKTMQTRMEPISEKLTKRMQEITRKYASQSQKKPTSPASGSTSSK